MTEAELIDAMQKDVASVKKALGRIIANSEELAGINFAAGRYEQNADAMIWQGAMEAALGDIRRAHGVASKALIKGYGEAVIAAGPIR